jgi:hypothetical protein
MEHLSKLAVASQPERGLQSFQSLRSFQILRRHSGVRLRAFFLSFDFDQRRAYFGGGVSNQSVSEYCDTIDWDDTTVIARGGPSSLEAVAILTSLPPNHTAADLSIACPQPCSHEAFMAELLDLAIDVAALRYRRLIVSRELASPELLALLRENHAALFGCENIEIDLGVALWKATAGKGLPCRTGSQRRAVSASRAVHVAVPPMTTTAEGS